MQNLAAVSLNSYLIEISLPEVSKIIGEEWNKLSQDQKKVRTIYEPFIDLIKFAFYQFEIV
jgi:hypothetical protein